MYCVLPFQTYLVPNKLEVIYIYFPFCVEKWGFQLLCSPPLSFSTIVSMEWNLRRRYCKLVYYELWIHTLSWHHDSWFMNQTYLHISQFWNKQSMHKFYFASLEFHCKQLNIWLMNYGLWIKEAAIVNYSWAQFGALHLNWYSMSSELEDTSTLHSLE